MKSPITHPLKAGKQTANSKKNTQNTTTIAIFHLKEVLCAVNLCSKVHALETIWYLLPLKLKLFVGNDDNIMIPNREVLKKKSL